MKYLNPLLLFALFASSTVTASETPTSPKAVEKSSWLFAAGQVSLDSNTAATEGIKDSATFIKLGWEKQTDNILFGLGLSGFLYSDQQGFTQRVEDIFGDESNADSSAEAFNLYVEGGYSYTVSENIDLRVLAGFEAVLQSERGIASCSDCASSDIDIDSGLYVNPQVKVNLNDSFSLALGYQAYLSGDAKSALALTLAYTY